MNVQVRHFKPFFVPLIFTALVLFNCSRQDAFVFVTQWGGAGTEPGQFREPIGVALDARGNVYITDAGK